MKTLAVCAGLLAVFFITACEFEPIPPTPGAKLRGTWVTNDPDAVYKGKLVISMSNDNNRITITGYGSSQSNPSEGWDDKNRPFRNYTRGEPLEWTLEVYNQGDAKEDYSEEGKIFIKDKGKVQEGIPYLYYEGELWHDSSSSTGYRANKYLLLTFGEWEELLENSENLHAP